MQLMISIKLIGAWRSRRVGLDLVGILAKLVWIYSSFQAKLVWICSSFIAKLVWV